MKAIILAAGYATRLYPLTKDKPKPLLPVKGKAIIDYIVDELNKVDAVDEIYVVSNHKFASHFESWAQNHPSAKKISVFDDGTTSEQDRLGAIGDIYFTLQKAAIDDEVVIIAGDNLFTFSLPKYYEYYKSLNRDCVCVKQIDDVEQLKQFAVAVLNEENRIMELVEKPEIPPSDIAVFATYMYRRETLPLIKQYLEEGNKPDAPGYFVQWLYKVRDVYAYVMDGECYDIGTPKAYEDVQDLF